MAIFYGDIPVGASNFQSGEEVSVVTYARYRQALDADELDPDLIYMTTNDPSELMNDYVGWHAISSNVDRIIGEKVQRTGFDSSVVSSMAGYVKPEQAGSISQTDTLNQAIGKLELRQEMTRFMGFTTISKQAADNPNKIVSVSYLKLAPQTFFVIMTTGNMQPGEALSLRVNISPSSIVILNQSADTSAFNLDAEDEISISSSEGEQLTQYIVGLVFTANDDIAEVAG